MFDLESLGKSAVIASKQLNKLDMSCINKAIEIASNKILEKRQFIKEQNELDIEFATKMGYPMPFIDRLTLSDKIIDGIANGLKEVALLNSPIGKKVYSFSNDEQGILVDKINVPFGVIGIIYEARPNVTADAFALCFKTKNAVILKGGKEAINSNKAIVCVIKEALSLCGIDENAITLIEDTSRETTLSFMKLNKYVDLLIPRGGGKLIKSTLENATIPIIETGTGNCHIFVDESADINMASKIIFNAKTQRYGVCNACESLVISSKIIDKALPIIANELQSKEIEIRADERAYNSIKGYPFLVKATDEDFYTEYCAPIISVKTIDSFDEAIEHINEHSTHHSESIITNCNEHKERFLNEIDSACVYVNASTRFSDGFVFGLGAEIGISTQKLHARGPMGLEALCTTKYIVSGNGSIRK